MSKEKLEEAIRAIKSNWPDERYSMLRDALDYVISEAERAESLQEKLNAKIALINKGDEEFCYTEQGKMIELEQQNKRYRDAIYSAERKCDGEASSILKRALEVEPDE